MGSSVTTLITIGTKTVSGKVLLESNELIIQGSERIRIPFNELRSLSAVQGVLHFSFNGKKFRLDLRKNAEKWLEKIKHPKSVFEKLGVKTESRISVINITDRTFLSELKKRVTEISFGKGMKHSDIIFYEANSLKELNKLTSLKKYLSSHGGIWVISLKGKLATIKDIDVMAAAKKCGLVDVKVVGFSETTTALKLVIPLADR